MSKNNFNNQILPLSDGLFRMAKSILGDADEAKDAVQDLMLQLWEKQGTLDRVENIPAFVYRSLRNRCLDLLRKRKDTVSEMPDCISEAPDPYQATEDRDALRVVQSWIDTLPELQRTVLRLRDVDGMEIDEIVAIMEISSNAVRVNLSRARQKMREYLLNKES